MLEDLFITDTVGEVSTSDIELSEDIENWPMEIQNIIYSSIPVLMSIPGQLNFDSVDQDKLYAKGAYSIQIGAEGNDSVVLPIVVKAGKLLPVDMYIYQGKWHPMDMRDITSLMTNPEIGTETIDDKDIPPLIHNNILNRISPPGAYNGIVSSVATKMGAANRKVSDDLILTIKNTPSILKTLTTNKIAKKRFLDILEATSEKTAETLTPEKIHGTAIFSGDRIIYALGNGKFSIKSAAINSDYTVGVGHTECDGDSLLTWLKEAKMDYARIVKDLKTSKMAMTWDDSKEEAPINDFIQITKQGSYSCRESGSIKEIDMSAIGHIKTAGGEHRVLMADAKGNYSLQREIIGRKISSKADFSMFSPAYTCKQGQILSAPIGCDDEEDSLIEFTPPTKIGSVVNMKIDEHDSCILSGMSCMGKIAYIITADPRVKTPVNAKYVPEGSMIDKTAQVWYLPANHPVAVLSGNQTSMIKNAFDLDSTIRLNGGSHSPVVSAKVWSIDKGNAGIKIGASPASIISKTAAMLLLRKAGESKITEKMAKLIGGEVHSFTLTKDNPGVSKYIDAKLASRGIKRVSTNINLPKIDKVSTLKIAAMMEDEEDVDTVLALNYINPQNMEEFKTSLPEMKSTEETLTKLLMASRLGSMPVSEQDAKNVLTSLHGIIKAIEESF